MQARAWVSGPRPSTTQSLILAAALAVLLVAGPARAARDEIGAEEIAGEGEGEAVPSAPLALGVGERQRAAFAAPLAAAPVDYDNEDAAVPSLPSSGEGEAVPSAPLALGGDASEEGERQRAAFAAPLVAAPVDYDNEDAAVLSPPSSVQRGDGRMELRRAVAASVAPSALLSAGTSQEEQAEEVEEHSGGREEDGTLALSAPVVGGIGAEAPLDDEAEDGIGEVRDHRRLEEDGALATGAVRKVHRHASALGELIRERISGEEQSGTAADAGADALQVTLNGQSASGDQQPLGASAAVGGAQQQQQQADVGGASAAVGGVAMVPPPPATMEQQQEQAVALVRAQQAARAAQQAAAQAAADAWKLEDQFLLKPEVCDQQRITASTKLSNRIAVVVSRSNTQELNYHIAKECQKFATVRNKVKALEDKIDSMQFDQDQRMEQYKTKWLLLSKLEASIVEWHEKLKQQEDEAKQALDDYKGRAK